MAYYWKFWANLIKWMNLISRHSFKTTSAITFTFQTGNSNQIKKGKYESFGDCWICELWIPNSLLACVMTVFTVWKRSYMHGTGTNIAHYAHSALSCRTVKVLNHPGPVSVQVGDSEQTLIWKTKPRTDFKPSSFERQPACLILKEIWSFRGFDLLSAKAPLHRSN